MKDLLLTNAGIVTMDDRIGDLARGDVRVSQGRIAAVGAALPVEGAEVIDFSGRILIPGLVNAHMHCWQTGLRGVAADWTLHGYFRLMHAGLAELFTPDDIYAATLVGAYNQINCGTTMLVDWCHNNPTPEHSDAAIEALINAGIRAAFFHGSPKPDTAPGRPRFSEIPHSRAEVERLAKRMFVDRSGLVTLGLAILGPHYSTLEVSRHDLRLAREFELIASMHQGGGPECASGGWEALRDDGLIGPWVNIVHGNDLSAERLDFLVELGASFSITPEGEMTQGHGFPIIGRLRDRGVGPSIGVDLESIFSGDLLTAARIALSVQRACDNAALRAGGEALPQRSTLSTRDALSWITVQGARMVGMADRIGSIAPGKQADLVVIDARPINMQPVHDMVSTVVMQTSIANVEAVMVAGTWRKWGGDLLVDGLSDHVHALAESGRRIVAAARKRVAL